MGGEALQLCGEHEYHLVIADATLMTEGDVPVLEGLLARRPDWAPRMVSLGQRLGGNPAPRHLAKPLDVKMLRTAIEEVLATNV